MILKMKQNKSKKSEPRTALRPVSFHCMSSPPHRRGKQGVGGFCQFDALFFNLFLSLIAGMGFFFSLQSCRGMLSIS